MICEGTFIKNETKFCSYKQSAEETYNWGNTKPLGSQKVGLGSKQPKVIGLGYLIMPFGMGKC
jgi:hypothetical protein